MIINLKEFEVIIDAEDYEKINKYHWHIQTSRPGYRVVVSSFWDKERKIVRHISLHRFIMNFPDSLIDHKDGNTFNNSKSNLRLCDSKGNTRNAKLKSTNTSGFKGVHLHRKTGKWRARICVNYRAISLGLYYTPEEAHQAYFEAAKKYYGEFARSE